MIFAADHQVPLADGPNHPRDVRARLERGELTAEEVIEAILTATAKALDRPEPVVIAHFLSILPKIGLEESDVPPDMLNELAAETQRTGQRIEISERWRCPSARRCARSRAAACRSCSAPTATGARRSAATTTACPSISELNLSRSGV